MRLWILDCGLWIGIHACINPQSPIHNPRSDWRNAMIRKYVLSILAVLGFILAVYTVRAGSKPIIPAQPVAAPSQSQYEYYVAGAGIIEASSRNIAISTPVAGLVTKV